jgi:hypothetical protein
VAGNWIRSHTACYTAHVQSAVLNEILASRTQSIFLIEIEGVTCVNIQHIVRKHKVSYTQMYVSSRLAIRYVNESIPKVQCLLTERRFSVCFDNF